MKMRSRLRDFIEDERIIEEILDPHHKTIMIIGGADAGKTTLIECIADITSRQTTTAIVDLDVGQSHVGLPTTIGWGKLDGGFKGWEYIQVEDFYFTGTLTPSGNLVPVLVGTKLITERAVRSCAKVLIDTTGLVSGPSARVLKQYKIDLISPDLIITLERAWELQDIIEPFINHSSIKIHRIPVPSVVSLKGIQRRSQYRLERFRAYFMDAPVIRIPYGEKGIRFTGRPHRLAISELKDRLVSLRDEMNRDMALGIVEGIDPGDRTIHIRTPVDRPEEVSVVMIGVAVLTL
jgi:polynucleotide 5'-hydroxyl-kinase GRC3/NOL9